MDRLVVAVGLLVVAVAVAALLRRRAPAAPTQSAWSIPAQLDRSDFPATASWLVVVFTAASCRTCEGVLAAARRLEGGDVAVVEVEAATEASLHERYAIDAVPTVVIADADGVVRASQVGPVGEGELEQTMGTLRGGPPDSGGG